MPVKHTTPWTRASHEILYLVSVTLLAAALLCATVAATAATRQRHGNRSI